MAYFVDALRQNPELAIFLTLALGFLIGRIRIGTFALAFHPEDEPGHPVRRLRWRQYRHRALRSLQDEADSKLPVLGYTVPYALGNILLTAWGPVFVMLTK